MSALLSFLFSKLLCTLLNFLLSSLLSCAQLIAQVSAQLIQNPLSGFNYFDQGVQISKHELKTRKREGVTLIVLGLICR